MGESQKAVKGRIKIRQTLDNRIYVPGLVDYFTPPIAYVIEDMNVDKGNKTIILKIRVISFGGGNEQ